MQEPLPAAVVPEDRRCCAEVSEREESGLRHHFPDPLYSSALHAEVRHAASGLQRPLVHLRRSSCSRRLQGEVGWS